VRRPMSLALGHWPALALAGDSGVRSSTPATPFSIAIELSGRGPCRLERLLSGTTLTCAGKTRIRLEPGRYGQSDVLVRLRDRRGNSQPVPGCGCGCPRTTCAPGMRRCRRVRPGLAAAAACGDRCSNVESMTRALLS